MIVVVTGLIRSGTSLIAKQLHDLGVCMGSEMRFPFPGAGGQLDWEDIEFTDKCLAAIKGNCNTGALHLFFLNYIRKRKEQGYPDWGVKSPYLLPYVDMFKRMANESVKVIRTTRNIESAYKSLERQLGTMEKELEVEGVLAQVKKVQDILLGCEIDADLTIDITESWSSPETVKDKLKELVWES